ncbi:DUF3085 domain-containing protein [Photobacterium angustum]|uniref:DUF3085 domain-containing protein n=1 Tax=Photobacterium angustum TaxID=661 RepID=A0ABX5GZ75_PHOAN|nr:DUF3085 domain-containing protein [Photobacterium angustum]PSX03947.1 DUF3085 domain-containing protein [Photobacterium angustum]
MGVAKFKVTELLSVLAAIEKANEFNPSFTDGFKSDLYPDNKVVDKNGNELESVDFETPDLSLIDKSLVEPKVMLKKDEGLYLMCNVAGKKSPLAYAEGCNPNTDNDYYDKSREIAGGDDFCEYLPISFFFKAVANKRILHLEITSEKIEISY